jgi:hypothetical protein
LVDNYQVSSVKRFDVGWLYLLCGLVLAVSAIVLPAHQDLQNLQVKRSAIQDDLHDLEYRIALYQDFLSDIQEENPIVQDRLLEMQFNKAAIGTPVVIDNSAAHTPLGWIAERARRDRVISTRTEQSSLLTGLSSGRSRLLLVGAAAFAMFVGLLKGSSTEH